MFVCIPTNCKQHATVTSEDSALHALQTETPPLPDMKSEYIITSPKKMHVKTGCEESDLQNSVHQISASRVQESTSELRCLPTTTMSKKQRSPILFKCKNCHHSRRVYKKRL